MILTTLSESLDSRFDLLTSFFKIPVSLFLIKFSNSWKFKETKKVEESCQRLTRKTVRDLQVKLSHGTVIFSSKIFHLERSTFFTQHIQNSVHAH